MAGVETGRSRRREVKGAGSEGLYRQMSKKTVSALALQDDVEAPGVVYLAGDQGVAALDRHEGQDRVGLVGLLAGEIDRG
jgi:hypothetical protein